jgi:hypothetical protein
MDYRASTDVHKFQSELMNEEQTELQILQSGLLAHGYKNVCNLSPFRKQRHDTLVHILSKSTH